MYSIVMLTALSAGSDVTPPTAPSPRPTEPAPMAMGYGGVVMAGCGGCYSACFGSCMGSCFGSCYGSCYGACYGSCFGCGCVGHRVGLFGKHFRKGCLGCAGYSCAGYNCFSSCLGCTGWHGSWVETGFVVPGYWHGTNITRGQYPLGYSCAGSCHGGALVIYAPESGPPMGAPAWSPRGYYTPVAPVWGAGAPVVVGRLADPPETNSNAYYPNKPPEVTIPPEPMKKPGSDSSPMGANLKFKVPADAKLYVDGQLTTSTGPERTFYTPPLERGKKFYYEVKAEMVLNGQTITEEKKVILEAGAHITEEFTVLLAAVSKANSVAGK